MRGTVVGVEHVDDVKVGIVDGGCYPVQAHLVGGRMVLLGVDGRLAYVEEGVDERSLS